MARGLGTRKANGDSPSDGVLPDGGGKRAIDVLGSLPGFKGKQGELAHRLGYSDQEFTRVKTNTDGDLYPEIIIQASLEIAKENFGAKDRSIEVENPERAEEYESRFRGCKGYDTFGAYPAHLKNVFRAMARANQPQEDSEVQQSDDWEPRNRAKWIVALREIMPWTADEWRKVLSNELPFPIYEETREALGELFACDASLFHPEGLVKVGSLQADWMFVDRLVLNKLKAPDNVRHKVMEVKALRRLTEIYLAAGCGEAFIGLPYTDKQKFIDALLPLIDRYDAIAESSRRPDHEQGEEVVSKIARQLPIVTDPLHPACNKLRKMLIAEGETVANGNLVRNLARKIDAPPAEVAYLLLGMATEVDFAETFNLLRNWGSF